MAISVSCYMAIAILTTIFIFPESMNHSLINDILEQLDRLKEIVETQDEVLRTPPEHLISEHSPLIKESKAARATVVLSQQQRKSIFVHQIKKILIHWQSWLRPVLSTWNSVTVDGMAMTC